MDAAAKSEITEYVARRILDLEKLDEKASPESVWGGIVELELICEFFEITKQEVGEERKAALAS